jgi:hypothetical protein
MNLEPAKRHGLAALSRWCSHFDLLAGRVLGGRSKVALLLLTTAVSMASQSAMAETTVQFGATDVKSIFFIAKSQNRNQVHYGVRLDENCRPVGPAPVYGYWRMVEHGGELEELLPAEQAAYGLESRQVRSESEDVSRVQVRLRGFPDRPVTITTARENGRCAARAWAPISGADARLDSIYLRLKWPLGIDYVLLQGSRSSDGRWIQERIETQE